MTGTSPELDGWVNDIHEGDAKEVLSEMPKSSVHMAMTSPPYYGLRDYDEDGQIGLEDTLDMYVQNLVDVGRELRRVLRDDGSWWLNLGDSYAGSGRGQWDNPTDDVKESYVPSNLNERENNLGRKNKMLVPHRVAIALQDEGWIVRNDVTWVKPNPMPSPVKDRLNTSTEQIFHLVPKPDYWYDLDAIREPHAERSRERVTEGPVNADVDGRGTNDDLKTDQLLHPAGKNPGDVFEVATKPFPDAHFAVYPPKLVEKPIKATCPPKVCAECGTPYDREVEREPGEYNYSKRGEEVGNGQQASGSQLFTANATFEGWKQNCDCETDETKSGIVLDPFAGAGTTALEAKRLGRRFIGIDLNSEYVAMAQKRVGIDVDEPELLLEDGETHLAAFADGGGK